MQKIIRSILFDLSFYTASFFVMAGFSPLLLSNDALFWVGRVWARTGLGLLKVIVGLSYRIEGAENVPSGACIIACKHQSAWETLIFHVLLRHPAYVLKRELTWIPLFNLYLKQMKMVYIDRRAGPRALKSLVEGARSVIAQDRPLVIYPEGTRGMPGVKGVYQAGVGVLYTQLNVPVIPVAVNSGLFWGRRSPLKLPGKITLRFLPPIQPGLKRDAFMEALTDSIENACDQLNKDALRS